MGFNSQDDLLTQISTNGKYLRRDGAKLTAPVHTAGGWHSLFGLAGNPPASTYPGTTLLWRNCDEFTGDGTDIAGILNGGAVASATKHILNVGANVVAAAGAPWQLKLVDLQGYYLLSGADVTGTAGRTLINANTVVASSSSGLLLTFANDFASGTKVRFTTTTTLPTGLALLTDYWLVRVSATTARVATSYANYVAGTVVAFTDAGTGTHTMTIQMPRYAKGVGCQAAFVVKTQPTAGGPNLSASSYTNPAGTAGRAFQGSPSMGATADAYAGRILHSGNAAGRYGPFLPLAGGDTGVASIESFTFSGGTAYTGTGVLALSIMRPLLDIPVPVSGMWSERDLVNQLPSLPQVMDGACLTWLLFGTGATTTASPVTFALDIGWGG
jgi:hypothetical protein